MKELIGKSIGQLHDLLVNKEVKAAEIADAHLKQAEAVESSVQAFNTITADLAISQAKAVDERIAKNTELPMLAGIPIAIKDNICVKGYPTTCSSKILKNFVPPYQATIVDKLFEAGMICVGKTNLDEFAMGSSTENSATKTTRNPWDTNCVPGGSSGGSAASVSSMSSVVALGSDTGGSIRQPASLCGIAGFKPTYGMVSRYGLVAYASSLDQIGPFARSVEDIAKIFSVISGHDAKDSTSYNEQASPEVKLDGNIKGLKIGLIKELIGEGIDADVRQSILSAVEIFKGLGAEIVEVSMPNLKHSLAVYYMVATAEASSNLARYDGVKYGHRAEGAQDLLSMYFKTRQEGFGQEVKRRIMLGTYALSSGYYDAYYKKAQQVRRLIKEDFDKEFKKFDILMSPTSPSVAFPVGAKTEDPLTMYLSDIATIPANLAGLPGISIPCGFGDKGLPIGLQLLAAPLGDYRLLNTALAFEKATKFHEEKPKLSRLISAHS